MPLHAIWVEDDGPEFEEGSLVITDELAAVLQLDQAELLEQAEEAVRWLCGDATAEQVENAYGNDIDISNEEGQEIFKTALQNGAASAPFPTPVLQAIARAFGLNTWEILK